MTSGYEGEVGLKRKEIPLIAATLGTIATGGLSSAGTGFAGSYVGRNLLGGTINATGNIIGQTSSQTDFDYLDPGFSFAADFVPGGCVWSTLVESGFSATFDGTATEGFSTVLDGSKSWSKGSVDFLFGAAGGAIGYGTRNSAPSLRIGAGAVVENVNNRVINGIEKK